MSVLQDSQETHVKQFLLQIVLQTPVMEVLASWTSLDIFTVFVRLVQLEFFAQVFDQVSLLILLNIPLFPGI